MQGYLDPENYKDQDVNESNASEVVKEMNDKVMSELMTIEEHLEKLKAANPNIDSANP